MTSSDTEIREILEKTQTIAMVGASMNPDRPSYRVMQFLIRMGKRVIPVNPGHAGEMLQGQTVYAALQDIPQDVAVDMVDVFRNSAAVLPIAEQALAHLPQLRTLWLQLGVENAQAAELAQAQGVTVIQNRCPIIEWARLRM